MSFILDALRKSEHDRERRILPGIVEAPRAQRSSPTLRWILGLIAALLVINTAALLYFLLRTTPTPTVTAPTETVTAAPKPAPGSATAVPSGPVRSLAEEALAAGRTAPYTDVPPVNGRPVAPHHDVPASPAPRLSPPADTSTAGLPTRRQLPASVVSALPPLTVDLHVYSADPAQRFMVISGQRAQEGATIAGGIVIEKITPDGAIADFRGTRFLLTRE
jgi:general secretion pathway protein B